MPTQEELRRAMAARAERKELEEARVAHDTKVRETWIQSYFAGHRAAVESVKRIQETNGGRAPWIATSFSFPSRAHSHHTSRIHRGTPNPSILRGVPWSLA